MRKLGLCAVRPKRAASMPHPEHKVYPYLLRDKTIDQPNQMWAGDITYIPMRRGFLYLVAIVDWATRRVPRILLAWCQNGLAYGQHIRDGVGDQPLDAQHRGAIAAGHVGQARELGADTDPCAVSVGPGDEIRVWGRSFVARSRLSSLELHICDRPFRSMTKA